MLFRFFHTKTKIEIWIYDQPDIRFEGQIIGFDEYMNLVLENCEEVNLKKGKRSYIGRILLKGDNISLIRPIDSSFAY